MRKVEIEEHQKATAFCFEKCIADRSPQPFPPSVIPPFWPSMLSVVSLFAGTYHISQHEASHVVLSFFWQNHTTMAVACHGDIHVCKQHFVLRFLWKLFTRIHEVSEPPWHRDNSIHCLGLNQLQFELMIWASYMPNDF